MRWIGLLFLGGVFAPEPGANSSRSHSLQLSTVTAVAIDPELAQVAWGYLDGRVFIADRRHANESAVTQWELPAPPTALAWSPDGSTLIVADSEGGLRWGRNPRKSTFRRLQGHPTCIHSLAFAPDGATFLSCGQDHRVRLWRASDGALLTTWGPFSSPLYALAVSPQGSCFAVGGSDGRIRLLRNSDGEIVQEMAHPNGAVLSLAFSDDGRYLLSAGQDRTVRLWDVSSGELRRQLSGHGDAVVYTTFGGSSRWIVSLGEKGLMVLWDAATGEARYADRVPGVTHCGTLAGVSTLLAGTVSGRLIWREIPRSAR